MKEQLLQFIWQYQYFNFRGLQTAAGEPLRILSPGRPNKDQGPDFLDASLRIGNTLWAGNIELHVAAPDWNRHAHQHDKNYRNVILHVVWEDPGTAPVAMHIPLLVLHHHVPKLLLNKYEELMGNRLFVACERQLSQVDNAVWPSWKASLLEQRLRRRSLALAADLKETRQHWEAVTWFRMARNFGLQVNGEAFEEMARSLPVPLLARYKDSPLQVEALLLGQAGLLEQSFREDHPRRLQETFGHLRVKHLLQPIHTPVLFLRMRPGNFPTIRLSQLAMLLCRTPFWFSQIKEASSPSILGRSLGVEAAPYWIDHYTWERPSPAKAKHLGERMISSLVINTFIPLLYAYGVLRNEKSMCEKALRWLNEVPAEKNALLKNWEALGLRSRNAADSQALLELKLRYCDERNCLRCAAGKALLQKVV